MNFHRAAFPKLFHESGKPPDSWEIAAVDTWADWYSLEGSGASGPPASALSEGLVTEFVNRQFWTLKNGKPEKVIFSRQVFLGGKVEEPVIDLSLEELQAQRVPTAEELQSEADRIHRERLNEALKDMDRDKLKKFAEFVSPRQP